jgi:3-isopropylmalate/(R)-2-methylmalate dehydratase large subunit
MTLIEKIIATHSGRAKVKPGEYIDDVKVDLITGSEITINWAIQALKEWKYEGKIFRNTIPALDHLTPCNTSKSAEICSIVRKFVKEHNLRYLIEAGEGIQHTVIMEKTMVTPGDLHIGADSHTTQSGAISAFGTGMGSHDVAAAMESGKTWLRVPETIKIDYHGKLQEYTEPKDLILFTIGKLGVNFGNYKAVEFNGPIIRDMEIEGRSTICNMSAEMGTKTSYVPFDKKTKKFVYNSGRMFKNITRLYDIEVTNRDFSSLKSDPDAHFSRIIEIDVENIEPQVAYPPNPGKTFPISEVEKDRIRVDQVTIGTCTNGGVSDLRNAAKIFSKYGPKKKDVRVIVSPASAYVNSVCNKEGIMQIFLDNGCIINPPSCGNCIGIHLGVLGPYEVEASTANRNFPGRCGDPTAERYLVSPTIAAATAIKGYICSPARLKNEKDKR